MQVVLEVQFSQSEIPIEQRVQLYDANASTKYLTMQRVHVVLDKQV
jgi:hypothetical protein